MKKPVYVLLFVLLFQFGEHAQADACVLTDTVTLDARWPSPDRVHEFAQMRSEPEVSVVNVSSVTSGLFAGSLSYSISGNRLTLSSSHRATFVVEGKDINCPETKTVIDIAQTPLDAAVNIPPNVLLIVDNSNTMVEDVDGSVAATCDPGPNANCVAGSASPLSKSEIIRGVARRLVRDYEGLINLGLMAYQQHTPSDASSASPANRVVRWWLVNRIYDVSYNPTNFDNSPDCSFGLDDWDRNSKCFRIPNPTSAGNFIHFNIRVPGYSSSDPGGVSFFTTREPESGYLSEPFPFNCYADKTGTSDVIPNNRTTGAAGGLETNGYSNRCGTTTGSLNDSARARGITHWGQRMVSLSFNRLEWLASGSPGLGYLHVPIKELDEEHAAKLNTKLGTVDYSYSNTKTTDQNAPLINAGLTPLEGTLYTARDYFRNNTGFFGSDQGRGNAVYPLQESCGVNAAIWLTDGMPSVARDGTPLGVDVDKALEDAVAAARSLHQDAGVDVYVVGFAMPPTVNSGSLDLLAQAGGTARAYLAIDAEGLDEAVRGIFESVVQEGRQTATSAAVNSGRLSSETMLFLSGYRPEDWSGDLYARNALSGALIWSAEQKLVQASDNTSGKRLLTYDREKDSAVEFSATALPEAVFDALNRNPLTHTIDGLGFARIAWLKGHEHADLRSRNAAGQLRLLGSIVNTTPVYSGGVIYRGQDSLPGHEGGSFWPYYNTAKSNEKLLFAGANDGKIHTFKAGDGTHLFSYMPSEFVYPAVAGRAAEISQLAQKDYSHRYFVNGGLTTGDAYLDGQWQRVLLATLGQGGKSVIALNVSNLLESVDTSSDFSDSVLWEFSHPELGAGVSHAEIVRLPNGRWAAAFGNGFNTESNRSGVFIVDLETGDLIRFLQTPAGSSSDPNGITSLRAVSGLVQSIVTEYIYAGDLHGNLWRFNLSAEASTDWLPAKLFAATGPSGIRQPIVARPEVTVSSKIPGQLVVLFGTGSFFRGTGIDVGNRDIQSFYGLHDNFIRSDLTRIHLQGQNIIWQEQVQHEGQDYSMRGVSQNALSDESLVGWYLDLSTVSGERVISSPSISGGGIGQRVRFNTLIVDTPADACIPPSRGGFLFELDLFSGAALGDTRFVLEDGRNLSDYLSDGRIPAALSHNQGQGAAVVLETDEDEEVLITGDGELIRATSDAEHLGRRGWEQLR